jgi:hypothetical protein
MVPEALHREPQPEHDAPAARSHRRDPLLDRDPRDVCGHQCVHLLDLLSKCNSWLHITEALRNL